MSDISSSVPGTDGPRSLDNVPAFDPGAAPQLQIISQYLKDFSFENFNAPMSLTDSDEAPDIEVGVNLDARSIGENRYEVDLKITATADRSDHRAFLVELVYGGLFAMQNIEDEARHLVCLIECPRMLFPFARRIIADATRDGGFPPLFIEPIDFFRLYREQRMRKLDGEDDVPAETE